MDFSLSLSEPDSDGPVTLELPEQWLWDIIDEFIYQYQSFCVWRSKVKSKTDEEIVLLSEESQVWSSYSVLNVLYSLIQKSKINEHIIALQEGKSAEEIAYVVTKLEDRPSFKLFQGDCGRVRCASVVPDARLLQHHRIAARPHSAR